MSPGSPSKARQERESAAEGTDAAPVAVPPRGCPPGADVQSRGAARDPALGAVHRARGTRDRVRVLDVHVINSLPVMPGTAYTAWVDSKPVQMVWGVD